MGHRLHSATKYEVKYDSCGRFNWAQSHINYIVELLAEGDVYYDQDEICYSDRVEANRERLIANIEKIKTPDPEWENQEYLDYEIKKMEEDKECDISRDYLYSSLKGLIDQADPNNEYVYFLWF